MAKLPTTFTTLDLAGFTIDQSRQYGSVDREMLDTACAVLQKNRVGIVTRSVQAALKHIYGIGGSADTICNLLKEWRSENLSNLKQGKNDKDLVSAILEVSDDGLLEETDIPEEYLAVMRQMAVAGYRLAYQKADTSVAGARMKSLTDENDLMKQQLKDFPQLQLELDFYKNEYERQKAELREAYMNLNKQQLADSEQFKQRLDALHQERNELESQLLQANNKLQGFAELESKESERTGEISRLNGQLETREREISALHSQVQSLQAAVGEKQVLESQLEQLKTQLKEANQTITSLQAKQKSTSMLEVDTVDNLDIQALQAEIANLKAQLSKADKIESGKATLKESAKSVSGVTPVVGTLKENGKVTVAK